MFCVLSLDPALWLLLLLLLRSLLLLGALLLLGLLLGHLLLLGLHHALSRVAALVAMGYGLDGAD